jgi:Ser/Thr protein kinase RdoA (MazF antagonist)
MRAPLTDVCAAFDLGLPEGEPVFAERGAMGSIFHVRTDRGEWAVKELFDWWDEKGTMEQAAFVDAAVVRGVRAPRMMPSTSGKVIAVVDGVGFRAYPWVEHRGSPERPVTAEHSFAAGAILATLHETTIARTDEPDPWYLSRCRGLPWPEFATRLRGIDDALADQVAGAADELVALDTVSRDLLSGPWQICHRDFETTNVLIDAADGSLIVVDWDNAGPLHPVLEIGSALHGWGSEPDGDPDRGAVRSFLGGYASVRELPAPPGLTAFSVAVASRLNYVAINVEIVLDQTIPVSERERSRHIVHRMIISIPSRARLEGYLELWSALADRHP